MSEFVSESDSNISKYNEAGLQILRLNNSWQLCTAYRRAGKFTEWKFTLDDIWDELSGDVYRKKKENNKLYQKIMGENKQLVTAIANSTDRYQLYNCIFARHRFLKVLQDQMGKGGVYRPEEEAGYD